VTQEGLVELLLVVINHSQYEIIFVISMLSLVIVLSIYTKS
jgi:hypothetical protein